MDPLVVFAIALAVFALFVVVTAYVLKSAIAFNSKSSKADASRKDDAEEDVPEDDEMQEKINE
jgi:cell division protein FtsL